MTDRRKVRRWRKSALDISDQFVRRPVESKREQQNIRAEMKDKVQEVELEKEAEKVAQVARLDQLEEAERHEKQEAWKPYESEQDIARAISRAHPTWDFRTIVETAHGMWRRYSLVREALAAGLKMGSTLREQAQYGRGWWWAELEPLTPQERGHVIAQVRRTVCD
jgi:hypothetical protein